MNFRKLLFTFFLAFLAIFVFVETAKAAPPPMFTLTAAEAQGVGSNEFYEGRCFRVNINIHTGGNATGGADAIIQYDNSNVTIVNSNCITPATNIYSDGLYNVYPSTGNTVSASEITLSAYENPGNNYTNNALTVYGHFYILVNDPHPAFALDFDYTPGSTVDTNIAELGTGNDIIASAENLTLDLITDSDDPYFDGYNPLNGAIDVAVEAAISYNMKDDMSGVDNTTRAATVNQGSGAVAQTVASSCVTTNANRVPQCSAIVNPAGYFPYLQLITVYAEVCDLGTPTQHCANTTWSFTTEDDVHAPYVEEENPADGAVGVSGSTDVVFHIKDYKNNAGVIPGLGVDIDTVTVEVDGITYSLAGPNTFTYVGTPEDYTITIDPVFEFPESYVVWVTVNGADLHTPAANVMAPHIYSFMTSDTDAPFVDNENPVPDTVNVVQDSNVVFQIHDTGAGVDLNNLTVNIAGTDYTLAGPNIFTAVPLSAPNDYEITIDPIADFSDGQAILVMIDAQDLASPINYMNTHIYVFGVAGAAPGVCPTCAACDSCCPVCTGGGGGGGSTYYAEIKNIRIGQIDESSVLVSWETNRPGSSRVVYGTDSVIGIMPAPSYGYPNASATRADDGLQHSIVISGLRPGDVYYFLPISEMDGREYTGEEISLAMRFQTITQIQELEKIVEVYLEKDCPVCSEQELYCPAYGVLAYEEENESTAEKLLLDGIILDKINGLNYAIDKKIILEKNTAFKLEGHSEANETFILTFEPQIAMSPVIADENGYWTYELSGISMPENYKVLVLLPDENENLLENLIGHFVVGEKIDSDFMGAEDINKSTTENGSAINLFMNKYSWFIVLSILLLLSLFINYSLFERKIKK